MSFLGYEIQGSCITGDGNYDCQYIICHTLYLEIMQSSVRALVLSVL